MASSRPVGKDASRHHEQTLSSLASLFSGQELFQVMLADQPAAPCLYRPELAGAQQIVDKLSGDAQQFSGLVRAVRKPLGEGVAFEDLAHDGEQFFAHVAGEQPGWPQIPSWRAMMAATSSALTAWKWRCTSWARPSDRGSDPGSALTARWVSGLVFLCRTQQVRMAAKLAMARA